MFGDGMMMCPQKGWEFSREKKREIKETKKQENLENLWVFNELLRRSRAPRVISEQKEADQQLNKKFEQPTNSQQLVPDVGRAKRWTKKLNEIFKIF